MGLFDSVVGNMLGGSPLQSVLTSVLNGAGGGNGLAGLLEQANQAGLGHVVQSWIGNGPNQPISPQGVGQVLGQDQVNQLSQQTGMSQEGLLGELAKLLPQVVDHATPNGQIPSSPFDESGIELPPNS
jgi:uncharacterized protein YidB (DUF937 family)